MRCVSNNDRLSAAYRHEKRWIQYMRYKKYGVHQGLSELLNLVLLQYSFSAGKRTRLRIVLAHLYSFC